MNFIFGLLAATAHLALKSYTVMMMYTWFILPITGWKPLTMASSLGIILFHGLITFEYNKKRIDERSDENLFEALLVSIILCLIVLLFGWLLS